MSCGTGGGHNSAAYAIKEELIRRKERVVMMNPYSLCSRKMAARIDHVYVSLVQKMPEAFGLIYQLGEIYRKLPFRSPLYWLNGRMVPVMEAYLRMNHFDIIIMTHFFPAEIMTQMKDRGIKIPKTVLVATDYTCIPFTEETDCDAYVIPVSGLVDEFKNKGIPEEKIYPLGIPTLSVFSSEMSRKDARKKLKLRKKDRYILVSGGSIGAGKLVKVINLLYKQIGVKVKMIVICGSNRKLYDKLLRKYGGKIRIIHHTSQMADYLRACDLYLTKPGGLSSTEAAVMGVALVHLPPIPGCETKNAEFYHLHEMSLRMRTVKKDMEQVLALMIDSAWQNEMIDRQCEVLPDNAAARICDLAANMVRDADKIVLFKNAKVHKEFTRGD